MKVIAETLVLFTAFVLVLVCVFGVAALITGTNQATGSGIEY